MCFYLVEKLTPCSVFSSDFYHSMLSTVVLSRAIDNNMIPHTLFFVSLLDTILNIL